MGKWVFLVSYTDAALAALVDKPEDRTAVIARLAESVGAKLVSLEFTLGDYDVLCVMEAPDRATARAVHMAVRAGGACRALKMFPILDPAEAREVMTRAHQARSAYRPPGS